MKRMNEAPPVGNSSPPKSGVLDKMNHSMQTLNSFHWLKTQCLNLYNFQEYKSDRIKVA